MHGVVTNWKRVIPGLWVGDEEAYNEHVRGQDGWISILAAKEPWHRQALGYLKLGAPKESPEYLTAYRAPNLILNFIDTDKPEYIPLQMFRDAVVFGFNALIHEEEDPVRLSIHCNRGESRSPAIAMAILLWLGWLTESNYEEAKEEFIKEYYPPFQPSIGVDVFLATYWYEWWKEAAPRRRMV